MARPGLKQIAYSLPLIGPEEAASVASTIMSGRLTQGPAVKKFEQLVASFCGRRHAVAVTSGTSALQSALHVSGIGPGWRVLLPAYTWVATYNAIVDSGARPIVTDVDAHSFVMTDQTVSQSLKSFKWKSSTNSEQSERTAIMPVHLYGERCRISPSVSTQHQPTTVAAAPLVIGDGCCSFAGVDTDGTRCGNWSPIECVSFHPRKLITTGEGGMVLCDDDVTAERLRAYRDHGAARSEEQKRQTKEGGPMVPLFPETGLNFRLTEMQGAFGVAQMKRIDRIIDVRHHVASFYDQGLHHLTGQNADVYLRLPVAEQAAPARRILTAYVVQLRSRRLDDLVAEATVASSSSTSSSSASSSSSKSHSSSSSSSERWSRVEAELTRLGALRDTLMARLVADGVMVRPPMISLLDVPYVRRTLVEEDKLDPLRDFIGAQSAFRLSFGLPLHPLLDDADTTRVVHALRTHLQQVTL